MLYQVLIQPHRGLLVAEFLVVDPTVMHDWAGNFVLPRSDVMKLLDHLRMMS